MASDEEVFIEILNSHYGIVRKVANAYSKTMEDRDDLIQEMTLQLWRSWPNYNPKFKVSTWMYRICLNVGISFYRKYRNGHVVHGIINENHLTSESPKETDDNIRRLYEYIAELNELNKALILLYLDKHNHEEIADTLGISKTNVSTKIGRIKKELKKRFND